MRRQVLEIEGDGELEGAITNARGSMSGWQVQDLDLTTHEPRLAELDPRGALFLGCRMSDDLAARLRAGGGLVFPSLPDLPFDPWRSALYTAPELYDGLPDGYGHTTDATIYAWSLQHRGRPGHDLHHLLATTLHDSSIDDALEEYVEGSSIVGVMGGHTLRRTDPAYADAAALGHALAGRGITVATGGGPGAMEAANLGARLADEPDDVLDGVVRAVGTVADYAADVTGWARVGLEAVQDLPDSGRSLGIPTWHYGHEPPNPFASVVAKYFRNAIREDVLLEVSHGGIVFLPGAAGTVQEVFQAACTNYYAPARDVAPMVFVGREYWTSELPVWPLVSALGAGRPFAARVTLVDETAEALAALGQQG